MSVHPARVDLYWLPLGAGGHCIRLNGRVYEAVLSRAQRRTSRDLFHAALVVEVDGTTTVVEVGPEWDRVADRSDRGAVVSGPVGLRFLGRWKAFRYEVRRWRDGVIPDIAEAVDSPRRLSDDDAVARRVLDLVPGVPALTWGRDELGLGEMWNSNSVIAWILVLGGAPVDQMHPPAGGRAPGFDAGVAAAASRLTAPHPGDRAQPRIREP